MRKNVVVAKKYASYLTLGIFTALILCTACKKNAEPSLFESDATEFSKDLALLSFDAARATGDKKDAESFAEDILHFDTFKASYDYDNAPTASSIGFALSHTKIGKYDLVAVMIRGFDYGAEWASNFFIGKTDDHEGFSEAAEKVYDGLTDYINTNFADKKLKLWISGYSRGGAVANILAQRILSRDEIDVKQKNMYVYTLEAPQGLSKEHALPYPNVFNIVNSADVFTYLAPQAYDLYRCGIDIDIQNQNVDEWLKEGGEELPAFVPVQDDVILPTVTADSEQEFIAVLLSELMKELPEGYPSFVTRAMYAETVQDSLCYLLELYMKMNGDDRDSLIESCKGLFATLLSDEDITLSSSVQMVLHSTSLYSKLLAVLTNGNVAYNDTMLQQSFMTAIQLVMTRYEIITFCMNHADNCKRMLAMHEPNVTKLLLEHYGEN